MTPEKLPKIFILYCHGEDEQLYSFTRIVGIFNSKSSAEEALDEITKTIPAHNCIKYEIEEHQLNKIDWGLV